MDPVNGGFPECRGEDPAPQQNGKEQSPHPDIHLNVISGLSTTVSLVGGPTARKLCLAIILPFPSISDASRVRLCLCLHQGNTRSYVNA